MVSELFKKNRDIDLRDYNISGVKLIDDFTFSIRIRGDTHISILVLWTSCPIPGAERVYNQSF